MFMTEPFEPSPFVRHPFLQTVLASSKIRKLGHNPLVAATREMILETRDKIRLVGQYTPHPQAKGLVILLNGWLGSSDSTYIVSTGKYLFQNGYSVFRLNYRDHGDSHHLNQELFYATLLGEVFECVQQAALLENNKPAFLAGFSLGGNFALRIARQCTTESICRLKHIISISPVLDPDKTTDAIDTEKIIGAYFKRKWRKSLLKKQALFPDKYDFDDILKNGNIRVMTEMLIKGYSPYENARQYFNSYSIKHDALMAVPVPTTIITAKDDPIIPAEDFSRLKLNTKTNLVIHPHGGHNGFIEGIRLNTWYERYMVDLFGPIAANHF